MASASIPYGSLISITTKIDMRYEGILQHLDPATSSIVLAEVAALGTEGRLRPGGLSAVPGSAERFPSIVFKGSDVKEIKVIRAHAPLVVAAAPAPAPAAAVAPAAAPLSASQPAAPEPPRPLLSRVDAPLTAPLVVSAPARRLADDAKPLISVFDNQIGGPSAVPFGVITVAGLLPHDTSNDVRALFPGPAASQVLAIKMQGRTCDVIVKELHFAEAMVRDFVHPRFTLALMAPGARVATAERPRQERHQERRGQGFQNSAQAPRRTDAVEPLALGGFGSKLEHRLRGGGGGGGSSNNSSSGPAERPPPIERRAGQDRVELPENMNQEFDFVSANARFEKPAQEAPEPVHKFAGPATKAGFFDTLSSSVTSKDERHVGRSDLRQKNVETFGAMANSAGKRFGRTGQPAQDARKAQERAQRSSSAAANQRGGAGGAGGDPAGGGGERRPSGQQRSRKEQLPAWA
jgi:hypothetical protein